MTPPAKNLAIRDLALETADTGARLLTGVSLTLAPGRTLALLGGSGAGKSLTALAIMGFLPPGVRQTAGEIFINGRPAGEMSPSERRRSRNRDVALILQNPMSAFDPALTVAAHFTETLRSHFPGMPRAAVRAASAAALAEAGFVKAGEAERILTARSFQLSGGMLQRIMLAIALVTEPSFLIADEATSDVDAAARKRILALLRDRARAKNLGLLIITHDWSVAAWLADEIAVMRNGRVIETGATRDLFAAPREEYTKALLAAHRELHTE